MNSEKNRVKAIFFMLIATVLMIFGGLALG